MPVRPSLCLLATLAIASAEARAQADSVSLRRVVQGVPAGARVMVEIRGTSRFVAPIAGALADGFALHDSSGASRAFLYQDVTRLWVRKRAIGAGAITGAAVGVAGGILLGVFASAVCESSGCPSPGEGALIGGVLFGAAGAGAGTLIGAAIPRWSLQWSSGSRAHGNTRPTTVVAPPARTVDAVERRRIGELTLSAVSAYGGFPEDSANPGPGVLVGAMASLALRVGRFALGPEAAVLLGDQHNWSLSGVARLDLTGPRHGKPVPYLVAGLGGVFWSHDYFVGDPLIATDMLTATLGLGVTTSAHGRFEARWQPAKQDTGLPRPDLFTVAAGYRFAW